MDSTAREEADRRFQEALDRTGARDPREFYRNALRELRTSDPGKYERAVTHFQDVLVPSIARDEVDPLRAWREYGRLLAELSAEGRTVAVDETGRAEAYTSETPLDRLVLHLPDARGTRALLVSLPPRPSFAQRATHALLVSGKQRLPGDARERS